MQSEPEIIRVQHMTMEEEHGLIARAESLHISKPRIMATRTEEHIQNATINPDMGNIINPDEAATY